MSLRKHGFGLGTILGVVYLLTPAAVGDEKEPPYVTVDGKRVPTRVEPPANAPPGPLQGEREELGPKSGAERRVLVRDLRHPDEGADLCDWPYRGDGRHASGYGYPAAVRLLGPHGGYYGYGTYRSARWWADAYRTLRYAERKEEERRFNRKDMVERKERLLDQHEQALLAGLQRLKEGDAARATVALTLAAKLNHGDPACRIHLAQARLSQGHYREAGLALRRALQLQPKLVYADLHLQQYYKAADTLGKHTDVLAEWVGENRAVPEVHFLLGYLEFQRGNFEAAHVAFDRVKRAMPTDDLTREYLAITKPARK